jgi:hypothetical protein
MIIEGFLARVNYENPPDREIVEKTGCPTGCLQTAESMLNNVSAPPAASVAETTTSKEVS